VGGARRLLLLLLREASIEHHLCRCCGRMLSAAWRSSSGGKSNFAKSGLFCQREGGLLLGLLHSSGDGNGGAKPSAGQ